MHLWQRTAAYSPGHCDPPPPAKPGGFTTAKGSPHGSEREGLWSSGKRKHVQETMKLTRRDVHPGALHQKRDYSSNPLRLLDVPGTLPPGGGTRTPHPSGKLNAGSMAQRELPFAAFDHILPLSSGIRRSAPAMPMSRHAYRATPTLAQTIVASASPSSETTTSWP